MIAPPTLSPGATPYDSYVRGAKDRSGRTIKEVIGRHRQFVVYVTEDDSVGWQYDNLPERLRPVIAQYRKLDGIARSTLGKKQLATVALLLGPALYAGLLSGDGEDIAKHFEESRTFIYAKATQISRIVYVLLSMVVAGIVAIFTHFVCSYLGVKEGHSEFILIGVSGGATGAVISIIQRARDLKIDPLDSAILLGFNGISRVVLGSIFGMLLLTAIKSNIFLGHFAGDPWALFGLAAGAGFTERWVPELLGDSTEPT